MPFYTKLAHILISLIAIVYIAIEGQFIIAPIIFAFLFAFLLLPFVGFLENNLKFSRLLSSLTAIIVFVFVILSVLYFLGHQISGLAEDWPAFQQQLITVFDNLQNWIEKTFNIDTQDQVTYISDGALKVLGTGTSIIGLTLLSVSSFFIPFSFFCIVVFCSDLWLPFFRKSIATRYMMLLAR